MRRTAGPTACTAAGNIRGLSTENVRGDPAPVFSDVRFEVNVSKKKSKRKAKSKRHASETTPAHPRDIADLAALVVGNLTSDEPGEAGRSLMIFVWQDCAMTVKFPDGEKIYFVPDHGHTIDRTVHEVAVGAITEYCQGAGIAVAETRVHMVPPEASTGEQIFAWFQSIPGISISVLPPEEIGFGGPVTPAGEAG
jgi:hypothetical protein